jgi:hypothetical protein
MLRVTVVGDVQQVARQTLQELGFSNEQLYRLTVSTFRRRVLPGLEEAFSNEIRQAAARRGLMLMVDVRGFRFRRNENGELVELRSQALGSGAERVRVQALENMWNERLYHTLRAFIEDNIHWMLSAIQQPRATEDWIA